MGEHGGHVAAFDGDALLVVFDDAATPLATRALLAVQCALELQDKCGHYEPTEGVVLRLHSAASCGVAWDFSFGNVKDELLYFIYSPAILDIAAAMDQSKVGETVIHPSLVDVLPPDAVVSEPREHGCLNIVAIRNAAPKPGDTEGERLRAIEWPKETVDIARAYVPTFLRQRIDAGQAEWMAENRRVSVVFMDLASLLPKRQGNSLPTDDEVSGAAVRLQQCVVKLQAIVSRYGGFVRQLTMDDKGLVIIVIFGLPGMSHADDPERAVRTALDMHAAMGDAGVAVTVGVTTGKVFCGNVGSEQRCEYAAVGDKVNLSARLMCFKNSPGVVIDDSTHALCKHPGLAFELIDDKVKVKGKATTIAVYHPRYAKQTAAVTDVDWAEQMIGRSKELDKVRPLLLDARSKKASDGVLTVVVNGRQGAGKTHFIHACVGDAQAKVSGTVHVAMAQASEMDAAVPFLTIGSLVSEFLDTMQEKEGGERMKVGPLILETLQVKDGPGSANAALLKDIFAIDVTKEMEDRVAQMKGTEREKLMIELLAYLLVHLPEAVQSKQQKKNADDLWIFVVESAHLLDEQSKKVLKATQTRSAASMALLLSMTDAAADDELVVELTKPAEGQSSPRLVQLEPLSKESVERLIVQMLGADKVAAPIVDAVFSASDGVPLFAKELVIAAQEAGGIVVENRIVVSSKSGEMGIPRSQQAALTSRIDRLSLSAQLMVKVASALGMTFWDELLLAVMPDMGSGGAQAARKDLDVLVNETGLFAPTMHDVAGGRRQLTFVSAAVRDIAYSLLANTNRRDVHLAAARYLEEHASPEKYPDEAAALRVALMHHWAGAIDKDSAEADVKIALRRVTDVGFASFAINGLGAALAPLERAREIAWLFPSDGYLRFQILEQLTGCYAAMRGFNEPETSECSQAAFDMTINDLVLAELDFKARCRVYWASVMYGMQMANTNRFDKALAVAEDVQRKFTNNVELVTPIFVQILVHCNRGDMDKCIPLSARMAELTEKLDIEDVRRIGNSPMGLNALGVPVIGHNFATYSGDAGAIRAFWTLVNDDRMWDGSELAHVHVKATVAVGLVAAGAYKEAISLAEKALMLSNGKYAPQDKRGRFALAIAKARTNAMPVKEAVANLKAVYAFVPFDMWFSGLEFLLDAGELDLVEEKLVVWKEKRKTGCPGHTSGVMFAIEADVMLARARTKTVAADAETQKKALALYKEAIDESTAKRQFCSGLYAQIRQLNLLIRIGKSVEKEADAARALVKATVESAPKNLPYAYGQHWLDLAETTLSLTRK